jgi:hypothetical protein
MKIHKEKSKKEITPKNNATDPAAQTPTNNCWKRKKVE